MLIGLTQSEHGGSSNTPGSSFGHDDDDVAIGNNSNNEVLCDEHFSDVRETSLVINSPSITRRRRYGTSLDVEEVKILTSRLNLVTRRPSVNVWMQQHFVGGAPIAPAQWVEMTSRFSSDDVTHDIDAIWSPDFRNRINASLDWLRNELVNNGCYWSIFWLFKTIETLVICYIAGIQRMPNLTKPWSVCI